MVKVKAEELRELANHEIVTLAVYLLGGEARKVDTEDIAKKANELAPGRFTWRKYSDQINIEHIRAFLSDAKKPKNGAYLTGVGKDGWLLTDTGLAFSKTRVDKLPGLELSRKPTTAKERNWIRRERERMLASEAYQKFSLGDGDKITVQEAQAFFRVDAYVTGTARSEKLLRASNVFGEDAELGGLIKLLIPKIEQGTP